jgi:hypothetical protein
MADRFHLDIVERANERVWFTLVVDEPFRYFVEQYHESSHPTFTCSTRNIKPDELARCWVNDKSLIKLVEEKFQELSERQAV